MKHASPEQDSLLMEYSSAGTWPETLVSPKPARLRGQ